MRATEKPHSATESKKTARDKNIRREARALAIARLVRQEHLRFLRATAQRLRDIGARSADSARGELLRLAQEIDQETEALAVVGLWGGDGAP